MTKINTENKGQINRLCKLLQRCINDDQSQAGTNPLTVAGERRKKWHFYFAAAVRGLAPGESWRYHVSWIELTHLWQHHWSCKSLWLSGSGMPFDQPKWRVHKCNLLTALKLCCPQSLLQGWRWKPPDRRETLSRVSRGTHKRLSCMIMTIICFTEIHTPSLSVTRICFQVLLCRVFSQGTILKTHVSHKNKKTLHIQVHSPE